MGGATVEVEVTDVTKVAKAEDEVTVDVGAATEPMVLVSAGVGVRDSDGLDAVSGADLYLNHLD